MLGGGNPVGGANPAGVGQALNYVGNKVYAYSGEVECNNVATTLLDFNTGAEAIAGVFQLYYDEIAGEDFAYKISMDSQLIVGYQVSGTDIMAQAYPGIDLIIPPFTRVIITAQNIDEALKLYEKGVDYVVLPHFLGGEHASNIVTDLRKRKIKLKEEKKKQIEILKQRKEIGHEHPQI